MSDINYEAHPEYASYGNWEDLAAAQKKEIERLREELAQWKRAADEGHTQPCALGPQCPYCEIERLRIERDEARKTMREWSENCGAEVQKLRSALHSIEQSTFYSEEANQIARKALGLHQEWPIAQGD